MKKILSFAFFLSVAAVVFFACNKKSSEPACTAPKKQISARAKNSGGSTTTRLTCAGSCGSAACNLVGLINSEGLKWMQCSCTDCKMNITVSSLDTNGNPGQTDTTILEHGQVQVQYTHAFEQYMAAEYPAQDYIIQAIDFTDDKMLDNYFVTFTFKLSSGIITTVSFEHEGASGLSMTIDCKGTCDCRERYYPGTGAVECTCKDDCKMNVSKLAATEWNYSYQ